MQPTVREMMTGDIRTIPCNATLAEAERILIGEHLPELFVTDEAGFVVGVIPDYALVKLHLTDAEHPAGLETVMSRRFLVIGPDSPLGVAARYLREHLHHRLAVVENRQLIGVLTRTRVLEYLVSTHRLDEAA
jgi:predicted transcriptional regulator